MKKTGRNPNAEPADKVQGPQKDWKLRVVLMAAFLGIALYFIGSGLHEGLSTKPTWQEVEATGIGTSWAGDFLFQYDFSSLQGDLSRHSKKLTAVYSEASERGYRLFSPEVREENLYNVGYLNDHPNQEMIVDPGLFQALEQVSASGDRHVFLAPAAQEYSTMFLYDDDAQAAVLDPTRNPDTRVWLAELGTYVSDPNHIRLDVTGEGKVKLTVSQEYLEFAEAYGLDTLFDFGIFQNAFLVDYLAEQITAAGYRAGYLCSFDGFTRNLDDRGTQYAQNLSHREAGRIFQPAKFSYEGPMSIVTFRNYPLSGKDRWRCYAYGTGEIVSLYLDPTDGLPKSALPELTVYSRNLSCGELALKTAQIFISDTFRQEELLELTREDMKALWFSGYDLKYTDGENPLEILEPQSAYKLRKL